MPQIKDPADLVKTVSEFLETLQGFLPTSEPEPESDPISEWARLNPGLAKTFFARPEPKQSPQQAENALKLALAIRKLKTRVHSHAQHINLLHDEEGQTRNMVIHCENLVAQAEARMREEIARVQAVQEADYERHKEKIEELFRLALKSP